MLFLLLLMLFEQVMHFVISKNPRTCETEKIICMNRIKNEIKLLET